MEPKNLTAGLALGFMLAVGGTSLAAGTNVWPSGGQVDNLTPTQIRAGQQWAATQGIWHGAPADLLNFCQTAQHDELGTLTGGYATFRGVMSGTDAEYMAAGRVKGRRLGPPKMVEEPVP